MFHIISHGDIKTYFAGWKHPSADAAVQRREPIFSRRGCAFRFSNLQLAISYAQLFQSQARPCNVVEMILDEKNRLTELVVDPACHFEQSEVRKLLGIITKSAVTA